MENVIKANFGKNNQKFFSADVYTTDRKLYRLETQAMSMYEAYTSLMMDFRTSNEVCVQCVAIYVGKTIERLKDQPPIKLWNYQQNKKRKAV